MNIYKKLGVAVLGGLLISQFFQPEDNFGDYESVKNFLVETNADSNIESILKKACFDCHSDKTVYPWYSKITPINYLISHHVKEGKEHINFSNWINYSIDKKEHKMEELYEEVEEKHMPLKSYKTFHSGARLSPNEIDDLVNWAKKVHGQYKKSLYSK